MAKRQLGIARSSVRPEWRMRTHPWLDMNTLKPKYSVQVREPEIKTWAHVYNGDTNKVYFFDSAEEAASFIKELQGANHAE
ncbi:putative bacteriophage protein [Burkholderia pseudomallei]|uniref:Bacteriophage protein n=1 Tax=Burkholderia pseudomallei TaxID=28450 RepID=A0AA40JE64_BURPE|nr:hypothetical protein [Burkholderia pseudomallei]KGX08654.1 putative bacteriophage protein [Burkholderia pseudomallei]